MESNGELEVPINGHHLLHHWEEMASWPVDASVKCSRWRETREVGRSIYILTTSLKNQQMFRVLKLKEWFLYVVHCRKLRDKIKAKMTEKQKLMYIMTKDRGKRNIEQDSMSTLFPDFIIDIPSPSIPQLQVCVACTVLTQCYSIMFLI